MSGVASWQSDTQFCFWSQRRVGAEVIAVDVVDPPEHPMIFRELVKGESDVVGLLAYSLHKQHKHGWLKAYGDTWQRMPTMVEAESYLLGETTPHRLSTYRNLAQTMLESCSSTVSSPSTTSFSVRLFLPRAVCSLVSHLQVAWDEPDIHLSFSAMMGLSMTLIVMLMVLWLMHSGATAAAYPGLR